MANFFLLALVVSAILAAYSWKKIKTVKQENPENFEVNEDYQKFSGIKKKAIIACIAFFLLGSFFDSSTEDLGVTPEDFAKNFNEQLNYVASKSGQNFDSLKILRIDKAENKDDTTLFRFIQSDGGNLTFTGTTEGKNLVAVSYVNKTGDSLSVALATIKSLPKTSNSDIFEKILSDIKDTKNWKNGSFTANYEGVGLEIVLNVNVANTNSFFLHTKEYIKKIRSK